MYQHRYVPNIGQQMATAEVNYLRLIKLMGDTDNFQELRISWPHAGTEQTDELHLTLLERFNYTLTVQATLHTSQKWRGPKLTIRLYQDFRMAEVVKNHNGRQYQGTYRCPNVQGLMVDEKAQLNNYLQYLLQQALNHAISCDEIAYMLMNEE